MDYSVDRTESGKIRLSYKQIGLIDFSNEDAQKVAMKMISLIPSDRNFIDEYDEIDFHVWKNIQPSKRRFKNVVYITGRSGRNI